MVCRACAGTSFDGLDTCRTCGAVSHSHEDTAPRSAVQHTMPAATTPEPTPAPARRGSRPHRTDDPASTNPGSGVFCGRCGSAVDVRSDFCGICGNPLNDAALGRMRHDRRQSRGLAAPSPDRTSEVPYGADRAARTNPSSSRGVAARVAFPLARIIILLLVVGLLVASVWGVTLITHHR